MSITELEWLTPGALGIVGTWEQLERLAGLLILPAPQRPAGAGPLWAPVHEVHQAGAFTRRTPEGVAAVDQALEVLGQLDLPFWLAPRCWTLLLAGWSQRQLTALLTDDLPTRVHKRVAYLEKVLQSVDAGEIPREDDAYGQFSMLLQSIAERLEYVPPYRLEEDDGPTLLQVLQAARALVDEIALGKGRTEVNPLTMLVNAVASLRRSDAAHYGPPTLEGS